MWQGLLRNIGPDDLLLDYLNKVLFGFAPKLTPDEVYLGDLVTALSAVNSGITCILDWSHINSTPSTLTRRFRDFAMRGSGPSMPMAQTSASSPPGMTT
jgi:hypothetical protein